MENKFAENLSKIRKLKGLSQTELAEKIGAPTQTIYCCERGWIDPRITTLIKLAEVLEVSTDELICGDVEVAASVP